MTTSAAATILQYPGNPLELVKRKLIAGHERATKGDQEWVEGSLEMAAALLEGRDLCSADVAFGKWLKDNKLDFFGHQDRAALLHLGADIGLARIVLTETKSKSYQVIWKDNKKRFTKISKPDGYRKTRKPSNPGLRKIFREMKLGAETMENIKGTTLDNCKEIDELMILNRGAPTGEVTPIVQKLVDDAASGKDVSAIADGRRINSKRNTTPLLQAWRKRMLVPWKDASDEERGAFIEFLMDGANKEEAGMMQLR